MGGRSYRPLIPLFCLVWDSSIGVAARIPRVRRAASPPWYRRARRARCKARQRLKCGIGTAQDRILLLHHHGSMAPKPASGTKETKPQKGKGRGEELQQNRIHFGLPQSVVQALQSIATRATQDLWSPTIAAGGRCDCRARLTEAHKYNQSTVEAPGGQSPRQGRAGCGFATIAMVCADRTTHAWASVSGPRTWTKVRRGHCGGRSGNARNLGWTAVRCYCLLGRPRLVGSGAYLVYCDLRRDSVPSAR